MHNGAHILAHLVTHLAAGDGTRIHQIVLDPDHLAVLLARLIVDFDPQGAATVVFFFFNDTATTEIYTLSLHDALPISFFAAKKR